ncbi:MAG: hypothetical protein AABX14_01555 [Candidatus Aenigmatarchaeota archaeon]
MTKKILVKKPVVKAKPKACKDKGYEKLDPVGYFLIRINNGKLEVGFCGYKDVNIIKKTWIGSKPQDVYRQIIEDMPKLAKDHCAYLGKELTRAWICMKMDVKYIQDGKMDGTFPEVDWLIRNGGAPQ